MWRAGTVLVALALVMTGCSGGSVEEQPPDPTVTSTTEATTTTEPPALELAREQIQHSDGWLYEEVIELLGTAPDASPAGCIGPAPPGTTNVWYRVTIRNLLDDRPSPILDLGIWANILEDGTVPGLPNKSGDPLITHDWPDTVEILAAEEDTVPADWDCHYAYFNHETYEIERGGEIIYFVVVGPVEAPIPETFRLTVSHWAGGEQVLLFVPLWPNGAERLDGPSS